MMGRSDLHEPGAVLGVGEVRHRQHGGATGAVERVGRQHNVSLTGDAVGHLLNPRAQTERVDHEQHARVFAVSLGTRQIRVRDTVGGLDVNCGSLHASQDRRWRDSRSRGAPRRCC